MQTLRWFVCVLALLVSGCKQLQVQSVNFNVNLNLNAAPPPPQVQAPHK
jgi:hypothetical protein